MPEDKFDWSNVQKKVYIETDKQIVSDAWLKVDGLNQWFLREVVYTSKSGKLRTNTFQVGDSYIWRWYGYADEVNETGELQSLNPFDFSFSFAGGSNCSVKIEELRTGTLPSLSQSNIPTDEKGKSYYHVGYSNGWSFYLTNLKSVIEGGLDLRNKDESMQGLAHA
jgi:hypothetical protein